MRKLISFLSFILLCTGTTKLNAQPTFIKDSLNTYIEQGMQDWNIPGLAIAIIKDGKIIVMKGFGVRDVTTKAPVDENTLFMIASNSKLFTATSLAQLAYDHKLSLNDKIIKYFPDFQLYDSAVTKMVTIHDMLSHHLGTKTFQGDFSFWDSKNSRHEIMYKMRYLKPSGTFRQDFGYCNSCFLTAGEIIPKVTGKPWEVYVYDSLIQPLGMEHTQTLGYGISRMPNAAKPHTTAFAGKLQLLPYDQVDNLGPAGSLLSCVSDLSKWLMMQLDSGRYNGKRIVPWEVLRTTRDMATIISSRKRGDSHFSGYGLGIFETDYHGKQIFWHTGGAFGFVTNTCFVPEENLGITILTNQDNQDFFELLRYQILNAYLKLPFENLSKTVLPGFLDEETREIKKIDGWKDRIKGNTPPLPLKSYTGQYENTLYGTITISEERNNPGNLLIKFNSHQNLLATLQYLDNDEWLLTYNNPAFGVFTTSFLTKNNTVTGIPIKASDFVEFDPYLFIKK
ncbi:MAG: serine hydrolase [Hydrotalea flava]|uniref:serine hydrolase n=1 Tax=Hydrotalea TaxID=1004300 RepID=UPI0016BD1789|nr:MULTISPECIES: serine hydrolase [Hydrotalea]MBY0348084.1 serine hydrolase [Hydrotalea flava]NIM35345.1 serine hydrolase [Hydrotalea flava]NIM38204.1 serine hydrolase [Hydrotalea flava]NIN03368.1 serine hydrolase [Hydrotalea flava]NIN15062.1 serine hydrolase [Hydrotalea flava]